MRLSVASHSSETSEAIAIEVDTVTASATGMQHMFIIFGFEKFIQGHADVEQSWAVKAEL